MKSALWTLSAIGILAISPRAFGWGNPASRNCSDLGGGVLIFQYADGNQVGFCGFGRALVEEWSLYDGTVLQNRVQALDAYFEGPGNSIYGSPAPSYLPSGTYGPVPGAGVVNPASRYCATVGGETRILSDADGNQIGSCVFSDGSEIEEFTLFSGPDADENSDFTRVLRKDYRYSP